LFYYDFNYLNQAEEWIKIAINSDSKNEMNWNLAKDHDFYSKILLLKDFRQEAIAEKNEAIRIFKECGADGWVARAEAEMALI
jgi:beta-galactosidase beta subunit